MLVDSVPRISAVSSSLLHQAHLPVVHSSLLPDHHLLVAIRHRAHLPIVSLLLHLGRRHRVSLRLQQVLHRLGSSLLRPILLPRHHRHSASRPSALIHLAPHQPDHHSLRSRRVPPPARPLPLCCMHRAGQRSAQSQTLIVRLHHRRSGDPVRLSLASSNRKKADL